MKVDVSECIVDLLHNGSKIELPGIGALYVHNSGAELIEDKIYPPYKNIVFTEEEIDSKALSGLIKRRYKVTKGTAQNVVKKFSQILINKLVNFNSVKIPNVGSFSNSDKGNFAFKEDRNSINLSKEYLPVFTLQKIAIQTEPVSPKADGSKTAAVVTSSATAAAAALVSSQESKETAVKSSVQKAEVNVSQVVPAVKSSQKQEAITRPYEDEPSRWRTYFWPVFCLLLLGLLLMLGLKKCTNFINGAGSDQDGVENTEGSELTNQGILNGTDTDGDIQANSGVSESSNQETIEYSLDDIDNIPESVFANGCTIIVGSFGKSRNALNMISRLKRMGYNTYKGLNTSGMTRVGIKIACDPTDFESILRKIRRDIEPTSWSLIPNIKVN